jgi:hypothetical protein
MPQINITFSIISKNNTKQKFKRKIVKNSKKVCFVKFPADFHYPRQDLLLRRQG